MIGDTPDQSIQAKEPRKWGAVLVWAIVLGLLGVLGLGLFRSQSGPIRVGQMAPDFALITFDGQQIRMADLLGRVVVVNFWASWCSPCEQEAAELEQAYQRFKDQGVVFLGVAYADTEPEAKAYLQKFNVSYPNGPDLGTRITEVFRTRGVPETYIIGRDGRVVHVRIGPYLSLAQIEEAVMLAMEQ
jgi:cytochrome c biogenesis protein CcmG/thiol:disulfide interchange protein DsbE